MPRNSAGPEYHHPLIVAYFRAHRSYAAATKNTTRSSLNGWAKYCDAQGLDLTRATSDQVEDYLDVLQAKPVSPVTLNVNRDRLCWFYSWAMEAGELNPVKGKRGAKPVNPMLNVPRRDRKNWKPIQKHISEVEYATLIKACGRDAIGKRDAAVLSLLYYQGLRRGEVAGLDLASYNYGSSDGDDATLKVGTAAHRTKNSEQRSVPLHPETVDYIEAWLRRRGDDEGALFLSQNSVTGRLTPSGISQLIATLCDKAGVRRIGVHEFRRAWAINLRRLGVSDGSMMTAAGWNDPTMVMRYTRAAAVELAHSEIRGAYAGATRKTYRPRLRRVS